MARNPSALTLTLVPYLLTSSYQFRFTCGPPFSSFYLVPYLLWGAGIWTVGVYHPLSSLRHSPLRSVTFIRQRVVQLLLVSALKMKQLLFCTTRPSTMLLMLGTVTSFILLIKKLPSRGSLQMRILLPCFWRKMSSSQVMAKGKVCLRDWVTELISWDTVTPSSLCHRQAQSRWKEMPVSNPVRKSWEVGLYRGQVPTSTMPSPLRCISRQWLRLASLTRMVSCRVLALQQVQAPLYTFSAVYYSESYVKLAKTWKLFDLSRISTLYFTANTKYRSVQKDIKPGEQELHSLSIPNEQALKLLKSPLNETSVGHFKLWAKQVFAWMETAFPEMFKLLNWRQFPQLRLYMKYPLFSTTDIRPLNLGYDTRSVSDVLNTQTSSQSSSRTDAVQLERFPSMAPTV